MRPISSPFEKSQRHWTLTVVTWIVLIASLLMTFYNFKFDSILSLVSLTVLDILCIVQLILNYRGVYLPAAPLVISIAVLIAITLNIYEGDGLFDPGIVAFPIYIIIGTMLFGKRSMPGFALSSTIALFLVAFLQSRGRVDVTVRATDVSNLIPMLVFTVISGLTVWVIMSNEEKNLTQIRQSETELEKSYELTLYGWAKALEYRDNETEGHSLRVVHLCQKLARELGCSDEEIQTIRRGAILHDIGKMGVPDDILRKNGPLEPGEWDIMHKHPQFGKDMIGEIKFLQPAMSIIFSHHERWDGTGYPQKLKGKDIPLPARIFAVIDNWDALNNDRPYRKAWPQEEVIDFIRRNAGMMFDPDIVDVFLKMDKS